MASLSPGHGQLQTEHRPKWCWRSLGRGCLGKHPDRHKRLVHLARVKMYPLPGESLFDVGFLHPPYLPGRLDGLTGLRSPRLIRPYLQLSPGGILLTSIYSVPRTPAAERRPCDRRARCGRSVQGAHEISDGEGPGAAEQTMLWVQRRANRCGSGARR